MRTGIGTSPAAFKRLHVRTDKPHSCAAPEPETSNGSTGATGLAAWASVPMRQPLPSPRRKNRDFAGIL